MDKMYQMGDHNMAVTIEQIMELDIIRDKMQLMAGKGGIKNTVSYVTIMEAPDFCNWVTGDEFMLTSWYAFSKQPELQEDAFINMAKNGIAGIGIKINRFIEAIPKEILLLADRYNVPIFTIALDAKFREIIYAISAEISNYQMNVLLEVDKHYKELVKSALGENGLEPLLRGFGRRRHCSCLCITSDYKLLDAYSPFHKSYDEKVIIQKIINYGNTRDIVTYTYFDGLHIFPCRAKDYTVGFLIIIDNEVLNETFSLMANQLTTFLTLKLIDIVATEQELLATLLDDMLFAKNFTEEELQEKLHFFGLKSKNNFRAVLISLRDKNSGLNWLKGLREYGNKIKHIIGDAILISNNEIMVLIAGSQVEVDNSNPPKWIKDLIRYVNSLDEALMVSVGPSVDKVREIEVSYGVAKRTLRVAPLSSEKSVFYYGDYLVNTHILQATQTPELQYLMERVIAPLREQDEIYGTDFLLTLEQAMFADRLENVASMMHVHVNTVRYRMTRIASITGYNFFSSADRYILTTALLINSYREIH